LYCTINGKMLNNFECYVKLLETDIFSLGILIWKISNNSTVLIVGKQMIFIEI